MRYLQTLVGKFLCLIYDIVRNDYMRDVLDHFYQNHDIGHHCRFIKLPMVKRVFPDTAKMRMIKTKPMERPSGIMFNIEWECK